MTEDLRTAQAFATSWNDLPGGSVYTRAQFEDWMAPLTAEDVRGRTVLELGCGNASLLAYMAGWNPARIEGVDLGDSVSSARRNMGATGAPNWTITKADIATFRSEGFDLVHCIGVLHHMKDPKAGLDAVLSNTRPGGRFHCWVYAREGNGVIVHVVDPIRRIASRLPWWLTKHAIATPLAVPYFFYAKALAKLPSSRVLRRLPLYEYSLWIAEREFAFFRHVAFDQLVTPQTVYIRREQIEKWLADDPEVERGSTYIIFRNGNSWKFGGRRRVAGLEG